jgi:hypothetical protein
MHMAERMAEPCHAARAVKPCTLVSFKQAGGCGYLASGTIPDGVVPL